MPAQVSYPGVYIEEIPSGVRTITGVATSITAFVGYTRKGVPDKAVAITSFADFDRGFGGLDRNSPLSYAVNQFYANGGTQAIIVRVASGSVRAGWTLQDDATTDVLDVTAASPGSWGNYLRLSVTRTDARNPLSEFNLVVTQLQSDEVTVVAQETHRNLRLDSNSAQYVESVINNGSNLITVKRKTGLSFGNGFAVSAKLTTFPLTVSDWIISGSIDGSMLFTLNVPHSPAPTSVTELVTATTNAIASAGLTAFLEASASDADGGTTASDCLKLKSKNTGESSSIAISGGAFGGLSSTVKLGLANGGKEVTGSAARRPTQVDKVLPTTKGLDGGRGSAAELIGNELAKSGIYALLDTDLFNLLSIPETFDLSDTQAQTVVAKAIALCETRRAFYIVDAPSTKTLTDIAGWAPPSRNAAVYFPALAMADPLDGFRIRNFAPSGTLAGVYSRTDSNRGIWKAPAGTDATLNGVANVARTLNDLENGQLNQKGINVLRNLTSYGRVAWGARTLKGADAQADEYKYIPVRRTALFLEESLYRGLQWVVFEPNDEPLWAQIRLNVGAFMQNLFRQGAFQGSSAKDAFFVKCDKETTTQNDIDLGIVNVAVGFAPLKPAEFVVIKLQQIAGQIQV